MSDVIVYSAPGCRQCHAVKRHLDRKGVHYIEVDLSEDSHAREELVEQGFQQVPIVDMGNGTLFSGFRPDMINSAIDERQMVSA